MGSLLFATGQGSTATLRWWFAFLVMTIAAERLEMTRLTRRRVFDIARRTVFAHGLSRSMAVCLLNGYGWLAVAGAAWAAAALGAPVRDVALHALGLGFIFSMMMGHAPVILPAIARVKLQFSAFFYLPLAALDLSLIVRLGLGTTDMPLRAGGAAWNAVALVLFIATIAGSALAWHGMAWHIKHGSRSVRQNRP